MDIFVYDLILNGEYLVSLGFFYVVDGDLVYVCGYLFFDWRGKIFFRGWK